MVNAVKGTRQLGRRSYMRQSKPHKDDKTNNTQHAGLGTVIDRDAVENLGG